MSKRKATRYKKARWLTGLAQMEVAQRTRLSQSVVSDLETGHNTSPTWETIGRLALLYSCSPFDLQPLSYKPKPVPRRMLLGANGHPVQESLES